VIVQRYIERNPVRAGLVARAQDWLWSSAGPHRAGGPVLGQGPVAHALDWLRYVNEPQTEAVVEALRECIRRRRPYGDDPWIQQTARRMGLEASLRPRGRPRGQGAQQGCLFGQEKPHA
jgi:putative transposase